MNLFYELGLWFYWIAIKIASLFNNKASQFVKGRKNWKSKLPKINPNDEWIWFQASSQGEFEDGVALVKTIRKKRPELKILLTFFSPSGFENKKNHQYADCTMYLPMDYKSNAEYFLNHLNFKSIFFVRHDIWKNYLLVAKKLEIPSFLIFCTLTKSSSTLKSISKNTFKKGFECFDHIFCHDEESKDILEKHFGITKSSVAGSTRVENIASKEVKGDNLVEEFTRDSKSIIIGSSALKDEKMLLPLIKKYSDVKWVIVPHEIDRDFSHFANANLYSNEKLTTSNVLIVNVIGLLSSIYKYCDIAIVGGGFSKMGIHNIIEPAIFGLPVLYGPNDRNYPESKALKAEKQAFQFKSKKKLENLINKLLSEEKFYESNYIKNNLEASEKIFEKIKELF